VPVGGQQLPTGMLLNALGTVAQRAGSEAVSFAIERESIPESFGSAGEALGLDVEDAQERADTLLTLLALTPTLWSRPQPAQVPVMVQVQPTAPALPPVITAGEWWSEDTEGFGLEPWEGGDERWDEVDPYWHEMDPAYG